MHLTSVLQQTHVKGGVEKESTAALHQNNHSIFHQHQK